MRRHHGFYSHQLLLDFIDPDRIQGNLIVIHRDTPDRIRKSLRNARHLLENHFPVRYSGDVEQKGYTAGGERS